MPHFVDLVMGIIGEPPNPARARKNVVDKFTKDQGGAEERMRSPEDPMRGVERHNQVPRLNEVLEKRETTGVVQLANSRLRLRKVITTPSRHLATSNSTRFSKHCPACRKLKLYIELQRMSLKPPCQQKSQGSVLSAVRRTEHKRGIKKSSRHSKKYPCHARNRTSRKKNKRRDRYARRRGNRKEDYDRKKEDAKKKEDGSGRNSVVSVRSVGSSAQTMSSREELPNDLDDTEEPMVS